MGDSLTNDQKLTHYDLVKVAARWLKRTQNCGVVLAEHSGSRETPDAIGWRAFHSILVECKVSRADFAADLHKRSRRTVADRPAEQCWYLTPPRLLEPNDLPEGWGLLEHTGKQVRIVVAAPESFSIANRTKESLRAETMHMYLELRRYQSQGIVYQKLGAQGGYEGHNRTCQLTRELFEEDLAQPSPPTGADRT